MDVSFILSAEEFFTLISLVPDATEAGQQFRNEVLGGAEICDLSGLIEKNMARRVEDELVLEPVLRMISSAVAKADSAEVHNGIWSIRSPWVELRCEKYLYHKNHWKITPVNTKETDKQ